MKKKGEEEKLDLKPPTPLSLQYPTYTSKYINTYTFIRLRYRDSPYDIDMTINLHTFVPILKGMQVNQQRFLKEGGGEREYSPASTTIICQSGWLESREQSSLPGNLRVNDKPFSLNTKYNLGVCSYHRSGIFEAYMTAPPMYSPPMITSFQPRRKTYQSSNSAIM